VGGGGGVFFWWCICGFAVLCMYGTGCWRAGTGMIQRTFAHSSRARLVADCLRLAVRAAVERLDSSLLRTLRCIGDTMQ